MSRRLLGPVGGPVVFFLVAALVFAGLGWVTIVSLRVEQAQREAAAQAELGNNLRVALWRLDGRMLPALGVEDSRPFYHYSSADPNSDFTAGPTPLLAALLPDWMKLHVQLDPMTGWDSPQVLAPESRDRVKLAWPEMPLRNATAERATALDGVRAKHPSLGTCELLAARERAIPADSPPFAVPLFTTDSLQQYAPSSLPKPPPPPDMGPVSGLPPITMPPDATSDTFHMFGWNFKRRDALVNNLRDNDRTGGKKEATVPPMPGVPPAPVAQAPGVGVGRGGFSQVPENDRGRTDYLNRAGIIQRAIQESKNAGLEYPYGKGYQHNQSQNYDPKTSNTGNPLPGGPVAPVVPPLPGPVGPGIGGEKDGKGDSNSKGPVAPGKASAATDPTHEKTKKDAENAKALDAMKKVQTEQFRGTLTEYLATLRLGLDRRRCLDELEDECRKIAQVEPHALFAAPWCIAGTVHGVFPPRLVPPAEDRPPPANNFNNAVIGPPGVNIHLGSMRPQWITAADGTETLVLVRVARLDNKTVYQGVILDWAKLDLVLKDEVKDLFPGAALIPVKNPDGVSPDRAMTALPVQLDPGPTAELPPVGWTPLRFGLLLAWVAAFIAFAAVGLSGWSLIDLAERRIRFVSAVTHELRTPLTSLRLYLDLLTSGMIHDEAKKQEYLNTLATESDRLHRLIDNVLDFARLEKRRKNGDFKPVKVGELLDQLQKTWTDRVAADDKELVVISTLSADTEVSTDAVMVHQIVGNLIDNARKYTRDADDKRIWLWAKPDGTGRVVFEVEDRGAGVPASERKTIFKPFRRGASAETTAGGAGLGLALAKQWAEVLGGTVAYRPANGAPGACFRLELPAK